MLDEIVSGGGIVGQGAFFKLGIGNRERGLGDWELGIANWESLKCWDSRLVVDLRYPICLPACLEKAVFGVCSIGSSAYPMTLYDIQLIILHNMRSQLILHK